MYNHQATEASFYQNVSIVIGSFWLHYITIFQYLYWNILVKTQSPLFYSGLRWTCKLADLLCGCDELRTISVWHSIRDSEQPSFISFVFVVPTHTHTRTRSFTHLHLLTLSKSIIYIDSLVCKPFELVALQACCLKPKSPLWFSLD